MQYAILLHASLAPGLAAGWADALLQALPYARRMQLESATAPARWASLGGIALALAGARRLGRPVRANDLVFAGDEKPRLRSGPAFSVSHTAGWVGCVVAAEIDVGLDLEQAPSSDEPAALRRLLGWTATEATIKAAGLGLRQIAAVRAEPDTQTALLDTRRYLLREVRLGGHTVGHVAATEALALEVVDLDLCGQEISAAVQCALGLAPQRA